MEKIVLFITYTLGVLAALWKIEGSYPAIYGFIKGNFGVIVIAIYLIILGAFLNRVLVAFSPTFKSWEETAKGGYQAIRQRLGA